jgi:transcriptional regulator with XRE-family HTH domain
LGARAVQAMDRLVAHQLRHRRLTLGLSQEQLAQRLNVSYQQIQKYETGLNRISAGRLAQIAAALGVPVSAFFPAAQGAQPQAEEVSDTARQTLELVRNFAAISDAGVREGIASLARVLAAADTDARELDGAQALHNMDLDASDW